MQLSPIARLGRIRLASIAIVFAGLWVSTSQADQACDTSSLPVTLSGPATGEGLGPDVPSATGAALAAAVGAPQCAASCTDSTRCSGSVDVVGHVTYKSIAFIPGLGWYVKLTISSGSVWTQTCDACP